MGKAGDIAKEHLFSKNALIGLVKKLLEYAALFTAFWTLGRPAAEDYVDDRITTYHKVDATKTSFRTLLSEEIGVQPDRIHIKFGEMYNNLNQALVDIEAFSGTYLPMLEHESSVIRPRLEIRDNGPWWIDDEDEEYRVTYNADGHGYYYKNGAWIPIFR